jgi:predicted dehydrogenase
VYQDKPMAATLAQADRILRVAQSSGITLMVAYHSAFDPLYAQVKQLLGEAVCDIQGPGRLRRLSIAMPHQDFTCQRPRRSTGVSTS